MKTVSQRNKLRTFAKPDEFKLQSSQPHGAVECGGQYYVNIMCKHPASSKGEESKTSRP